MRKTTFTILAVAAVCMTTYAQPAGYKVVDNPKDFKIRFAEESKKVTSVRCNFVQEKNLSLLEEKIISEGKFWYKKENKVRLEYQKPFRYLMILNADQMITRDEQKESRISTHSSKLFQQLNRIIMGCVNGSILDSKDFSSQVFQNEKTYVLTMSPNSKSLKEFFQTIQVTVDKKDWSVSGITMLEPGGDNTIIKFMDRVYNENLNDSLFLP
jgi:outer membrane lipoprotein-sorting protein